jgi:glutamate 5-kinase
VIPIINENDTVTTDEIRVGDNDTLGALVANLIEADVLVLLTDQSGLYNADPRKDARRDARARGARGRSGARGDGGRRGQLARQGRACYEGAARKARRALGRVDGDRERREANVLTRLAAGEAIGTVLAAPTVALAARKQWLADHVQLAGSSSRRRRRARARAQTARACCRSA